MTPLDKMWASFVAIGLMAGSSLLIVYARTWISRGLRVAGTILAFLLLLVAFVYAAVALL